MAWENKRKIHVARGSTANIVALNNEENKFTDGQPLFNKDRGYLGIATGTQDAKNIVPIKVRTIEGWGNEIDSKTGSYLLKPDGDEEGSKANYYLFTGDSNGTYLKSDNPLYFIKGNISPNNYSTDYIFALINKNDNNIIDIKAPITTNSNINVGNNATLTSTNINVTYLKNNNTPYVTLGSSLIALNQDTKLDDGKSFTSGYSTTLGTHADDAYSGTNNIYGDTTIVGGTIELNSVGNANPVEIMGSLFQLSAPTDLLSTITGKSSSTTTLSIVPSTGSINAKSLKITSNGQGGGTNYLSVTTSNNSTTVNVGGALVLNNSTITGVTSITASDQIQGNTLKSTGNTTVGGTLTVNGTGTHTFKGDIDATDKTITCGTLNVSAINFNL